MPRTKTITADQLRDVMTNNPTASNAQLAKLLNVGYSTFQKKIADDDELSAIYGELKGDRRDVRAEKKTARKARRASAAPPPANLRPTARAASATSCCAR